MGILFVPLASILSQIWGVLGVAFSLCIVNLPCAIINYIQYKRVINAEGTNLCRKYLVFMKKLRAIAFYLLNTIHLRKMMEWWGAGFTEWRNVTKAQPRYRGHYQPHLPADLGFYDLCIPEVRDAQARLALDTVPMAFVITLLV